MRRHEPEAIRGKDAQCAEVHQQLPLNGDAELQDVGRAKDIYVPQGGVGLNNFNAGGTVENYINSRSQSLSNLRSQAQRSINGDEILVAALPDLPWGCRRGVF